MSHAKKVKHSHPDIEDNPSALVRLEFEKEEAKLKRRRIKRELEMWQAEIDLLKLYAKFGDDAKPIPYDKQIAELERKMAELKEQFSLIKKFKKHEPQILVTAFARTLEETTAAFANAEKTLEQARPQMEAVLA